MKTIRLLVFIFCCTGMNAIHAQQRLVPGSMNYVRGAQPNNIIYHDTLYTGSQQFKYVFFRTGDRQLIHLYKQHQTNKIVGQILGLVGSGLIGVGVGTLGNDNKGPSWVMIGGGFATALVGGYLTFRGAERLQMAVTLFNQKYRTTAFGIGISGRKAGLVYNF